MTVVAAHEEVLMLRGSQGPMVGILHRPVGPQLAACVVVAGQPQTRVGSHRVFVRLARGLAGNGIAVLRFDCSGWGDSPGGARPFEQSTSDIAAAVEALAAIQPPGTPLALVGLCDGATAAALALDDLAVRGIRCSALTLVNPWVRSESTRAESLARTYYARKAFDLATVRRIMRGELRLRAVAAGVRDWIATSRQARRSSAAASNAPSGAKPGAPSAATAGATSATPAAAIVDAGGTADLPTQLREQLERHADIRVSVVLSGRDLTAGEFEALLRRDRRLRQRLQRRGTILRLPEADHMLSDRRHQAEVVSAITGWYRGTA